MELTLDGDWLGLVVGLRVGLIEGGPVGEPEGLAVGEALDADDADRLRVHQGVDKGIVQPAAGARTVGLGGLIGLATNQGM